MRSVAAFIVVLCFSYCTGNRHINHSTQVQAGDILIKNVNILDVEKGTVIANQDVLINSNRVTYIGNYKKQFLSALQTIDGEGKFLLPGLWDMHAHALWGEPDSYFNSYASMKQMLLFGITGFRDPHGVIDFGNKVKRQLQNKEVVVPRFVHSNLIDGYPPIQPGALVVQTPDEGRKAVDSLKNAGVDFIKTYWMLQPDVFYAIVDASKKAGLKVTGHIPYQVSLSDAIEQGMSLFDHMDGLTEASSLLTDSIIHKRDVHFYLPHITRKSTEEVIQPHKLALQTYDETKNNHLLLQIKKHNVFVVPTLTIVKSFGTLRNPDWSFTPDSIFVSSSTIPFLDRKRYPKLFSQYYKSEDFKVLEDDFAFKKAQLRKMDSMGINLLIGTDVPVTPYLFGLAVHDEMQIWKEAGLSESSIIKAATLNPAIFLGMQDSLGSVAIGKIADLLLLDKNPLDDIKNTRSIHAVIINGTLFTRKELDATKEEVIKIISSYK
jgi:hypothetical protein